ncbi:MAG: hypothetical protein Q8S33_03300 [Myxococcales bacterium]|nr:hypothetical protein [Myxococcales bacterium]MDP3499325.1 hypothetical protein [Myxococcales bacterium]
MPVEVFVLGREPLPRREGGWTLRLGPVRILEGVDLDRIGELPSLVPLVTALTFSSDDERACFAMASDAAQLVRGQVVTTDGLVLNDFEHDQQAPLSAATVEARLRDALVVPIADPPKGDSGPDWSDL